MKIDPVTAYARAVTGRKVLAGRLVRLACRRHLADLKGGKRRGLVWKAERAQHVIDFFAQFLTLGDGKPFVLQPWQAFIVGSLFGWFTADAGRRFRTGYIEVAKGNGKTPMAAGIGLYGLIADGEPEPEIYSGATAREQARICFEDAKHMVERSPELRAVVEVNVASLSVTAQNAAFKPISSEHRGLDGHRPHIALVDEVHEHRDAMVVDKLRAGTKGRTRALIFEITNSGYDRNTVCWQHHDFSVKVLEGTTPNDAWFAYVAALDPKDDWLNEKIWPKCNPNLGVSVTLRYLREQVAEAVGMPTKENIVRRLNFCQWTQQAVRWIPIELWRQGAKPAIEEAALIGRDCWGGLDLSTTEDLTALCLLFPMEDGTYQPVMRYWCPAETLAAHAQRDNVPYQVWERQGLLEATEGDVVDYDVVRTRVQELGSRFVIRELAYDRWNASQLVTQLQADGLTMVPFGQGFQSMASPCKELMTLLRAQQLHHGGHPVLDWNVGNAAVTQDPAGNIKPNKAKSTGRIDGLVALIMALGRAQLMTHTSELGISFV